MMVMFMVFFAFGELVLVVWGVAPIQRNGYGIWGQNCNKIFHFNFVALWYAPLWSQHLFFCWNHRAPHPWTKTRNIKDEISASPKQDFSPQATTNHSSTIKALQTTRITKIKSFVSPLIVFQQRVHHIRIEKQIHIFSIPREKICLFMIWFFDLLLIRPLMYTHSRSPKTLYLLYQMWNPTHISLPWYIAT